MTRATDGRADTQARIVDVAARLLDEEGPAGVTTRGVAERAGVQPPTIYRLFGDKDGLLEAVAEHVMATYVAAKAEIVESASTANVDPVDDLRDGWTMQIDFGLANPALFRLLSDPDRMMHSPAARAGQKVLETRIHRIAMTGRLRVSERHAVDLIQAAGTGAVHTLVSQPRDQRDPHLAPSILDAVLAHILTDAPAPKHRAPIEAAVAVRAVSPELDMLTEAERRLLAEWLGRVIEALSVNH